MKVILTLTEYFKIHHALFIQPSMMFRHYLLEKVETCDLFDFQHID